MDHVHLVVQGGVKFALTTIGVFASHDGANEFVELLRKNQGGIWSLEKFGHYEIWTRASDGFSVGIERQIVHP